MSTQPQKPVFLIDAYTDPVWAKIQGRAGYQNCGPFSDFIKDQRKKGKSVFCVDFQECEGLDSTVLGIFAGLAIELANQSPKGALKFYNLKKRNKELVENLGLHKFVEVIESSSADKDTHFKIIDASTMATSEEILCAHRNLVNISPSNAGMFQDVLDYLESQQSMDISSGES